MHNSHTAPNHRAGGGRIVGQGLGQSQVPSERPSGTFSLGRNPPLLGFLEWQASTFPTIELKWVPLVSHGTYPIKIAAAWQLVNILECVPMSPGRSTFSVLHLAWHWWCS